MKMGFAVDALLYRGRKVPVREGMSTLATPLGPVRVLDTGGSLPALVLVPDGPNVIEHYAGLVDKLRAVRRVIVLDFPGFGFSFPRQDYRHGIEQGAAVILSVLQTFELPDATLCCSCVNGFYAIAAAKRDVDRRIGRLVLSQTPSLSDMRAWAARIVPKPFGIPLLGQFLQFILRKKLAANWYHMALARKQDRPRFKSVAAKALDQGACFCLASVVQGMFLEPAAPPILQGVTIPVSLIWGTQDRSHKPTDPRSVVSHLPQADTRLWKHCGHFPDLEDEIAFVEVVLQRHDPR